MDAPQQAEARPADVPVVDRSRYPELGARYRSIVIDTMVLITFMFIAGYALDPFPDAPEGLRKGIFFFIWFGYEPLAMTFLGATLGNRVMRIRVRKAADESRRIDIAQAYLRYVVKLCLGWLSFLTMGSDTKLRAIHDKVSGSVMVREEALTSEGGMSARTVMAA
ncbi:MAG: RDD family protein [Bacteroidetes bacterium]|nr:RDD family protein [Bacteroidota bacterium]